MVGATEVRGPEMAAVAAAGSWGELCPKTASRGAFSWAHGLVVETQPNLARRTARSIGSESQKMRNHRVRVRPKSSHRRLR